MLLKLCILVPISSLTFTWFYVTNIMNQENQKKVMDKYFNFLSSMYNMKVISYCVGLLSRVFIHAM